MRTQMKCGEFGVLDFYPIRYAVHCDISPRKASTADLCLESRVSL